MPLKYIEVKNDRSAFEAPRLANEHGLAVENSIALDEFPFATQSACLLRIKAFANGALFVLYQKMASAVRDEDKAAIAEDIDAVMLLTERRVQDLEKFEAQKNSYANQAYQFNVDLAAISGLTKKDIALGEAFWTWQVYERPKERLTKYRDDTEYTIVQRDIPLKPNLTANQKADLLKIHQDDERQEPEWFKELLPWAKAYLRTIVPKPPGSALNAWDAYQKTIPATLRHIPGQANAVQHVLEIYGPEGHLKSRSVTHKHGVPSPYEMSSASSQQESATANVQAIMDEIGTEEKRKEVFAAYWGLRVNDPILKKIFNEKLPPIFLFGLVTPTHQASWIGRMVNRMAAFFKLKENNQAFYEQKAAAVKAYEDKPGFFNLNFALNQFRGRPVPVDPAFLQYHQEFLAICKQIAPHEAQQKISSYESALKDLEQVNAIQEIPGRNKNLYTAALLDVATRLAGGVALGHCKSSKDRKAMEEMMADAMMIYYEKYQEFPKYADPDPKRLHFLEIFKSHYIAGHQSLSAHDNSPGSAGIKDEKILDHDMKLILGEAYEISKNNAQLNKPKPKFSYDVFNILSFFYDKFWGHLASPMVADLKAEIKDRKQLISKLEQGEHALDKLLNEANNGVSRQHSLRIEKQLDKNKKIEKKLQNYHRKLSIGAELIFFKVDKKDANDLDVKLHISRDHFTG